MTRKDEPETAASLRGDLDAGKGRDKVPYPDPAAAPLGTDDEAAGTPVSDEQARMARRHEIRGAGDEDTAAPGVTHGRETRAFDSDASLQPRGRGAAGQAGRAGDAMSSTTGYYIALGVVAVLIALVLFVLLR